MTPDQRSALYTVAAWYRRSRKTVVAAVTATVAWGQLVIQSEPVAITAPEWMVLATGLLGALGVYATTNED